MQIYNKFFVFAINLYFLQKNLHKRIDNKKIMKYIVIINLRFRKKGGVNKLFNSLKFKNYVVDRGKTLSDVANHIGINITTLSRKMNGESDFYRHEVQAIANYLNLTKDDVNSIFFN
nr:MAG TPA: helix-turn-helix domain protein [Caudoviricetes sp.]